MLPRPTPSLARWLHITSAMTAASLLTSPALALPQGGQVVGGQASITTSGLQTTVTQATDQGIIHWQSFDVAAGERVQFQQPSASSVTLNRVTGGGSASQIMGQISANGTVMLVNPNGVIFGPNAQVNVGSLVATTADIDNDRFMAGDLRFDKPGNPNAAIVNQGTITVADAGLAALVAPNVLNNGVIQARLGKVTLASGDKFTLDLYGDGLIQLEASEAIQNQLVNNSGIINAAGGKITLTAAAAADAVNSLINTDGIIEATSIGEVNGEIEIFAEGSHAVRGNNPAQKGQKSGSSTVLVSGVLDVSGRRSGERGGKLTITGDNVAVLKGTLMDASGHTGLSGTTAGKAISAPRDGSAGGDIRIGGDYLGQGSTPTAQNLYVDSGALILNDSLFTGDAGRTIFWSDGTTQFYGNVYARALGGLGVDQISWGATAGGNPGDGGFVETSGHQHLDAGGYVNLTASHGEKGTYFLDPTDITIYGNFDPTFQSTDGSINLGATIKLWIDASDTSKVSLTYSTDSLSGATVTGSSGSNTLTTSTDVSSSLAVGARIRLGSAGSVTTADTVGADTYTIASISGTNITLTSNLTQSYTGSTLFRGLVSSIADRSGLGNTATQATATNMPLWVSNGINGIGVIRPDGMNDFLAGSTSLSGSNLSAFAAFTNGNYGSGFARVLSLANDDSQGDFGSVTNVAAFLRMGNNTVLGSWRGGNLSSGSIGLDTGTIAATVFDGSTNTFSINSASNSAVSSSGSFAINNFRVGGGTGNDPQGHWGGNIGESILYGATASPIVRNLIEQYQSAKWGIALSPPGTGATEVAKATASDGYSAFTTRYLERLSQSANVSLQATNNITLDLKGDTINFSTAGRTFSLTAGNQITTASAGGITTNGGAIYLAGTNGILLNHSLALNSQGGNITLLGDVTLGANQTINAGAAPLLFWNTVNGGYHLTVTSGNMAFGAALGGTTPLGAVSLTATNGMTLPSITASSISIQTTGTSADITIPVGRTLTATGSGSSLVLASGRNFINNAGAGALSTPAGRWLIYSADPAQNTLGGLTAGFAQYNTTFAGNPPGTIGNAGQNGLLYSLSNVLTFTADSLARTYGAANPGLTYSFTCSSGCTQAQAVTGTPTLSTLANSTTNVGTSTITISMGNLALTGPFAGYAIQLIDGTLTINQAPLTVTANNLSKTYGDTLSFSGNEFAASGLRNGETIGSVALNSAGAISTATVAGGPYTITASSASGGTFNPANYAITYDPGTLTVVPRALTASLTGSVTKTYDGTTDATLTNGNYLLTGIIGGDTVTLNNPTSGTFDTKAAGTGKTVSVNGLSLSGADASNYTLATTSISGTIGAINRALLSIFGVTTQNKTYDGTTTASLNNTSASLSGVIGGDTVNLLTGSASGSFADKNVGVAKSVTANGYSIGGADAGNYTLSQPTGLTANITARSLNITGVTAQDKVYDTTTTATLTGGSISTGTGLVAGDIVNLSTASASGSFADKNVGVAKSVTATGYSINGADSGNYTLLQPTGLTATITARGLSITGVTAQNKTYDATTAATLNNGSASLSGVLGGDTVNLLTGSASATFADKNVGVAKSVTASGYTLSGTDSGNYTLTQPTGLTANITPKTLNISGVTAQDKTYDATTTATLTGGSISTGTGLVAGDIVNLSTASASGSFTDKNVGVGKSVIATGYTISGTDSGNYTLAQPTGLTATITQKLLSITGVTSQNKTYDATTAATLNNGSASLSGVLGGDTVNLLTGSASATFADKNVGTGKAITASGYSIGGADSTNYALNQPTGLTADIVARSLSITGVTAQNKTYDATTTATLNNGSASLSGVLGGDTVNLLTRSASATFADKNVGVAKSVTAAGYTLSGTDSGNYTLTQPTGLTANITARTLTASLTGTVSKTYDGTTTAALASGNYSLAGVLGGDTVSLNNPASGTYDTRTVGTGKTVSVNGLTLSGTDAGNYTLAATSINAAIGTILHKALGLSGVTVDDKIYDGTTAASLNIGSAALTGLIGGDTVNLLIAGATAAFTDKNVGNAKAIAVSGVTLTGADAGNYSISQPAGLTASITPKTLAITGVTAQNKIYDGTSAATLTGGSISTGTGLIAGDVVNLLSGSASGSFADKNVGTSKAVSAAGYSISGADAGNYTLTQPTGLTANISARSLSIAGVTAQDRVYDGTTTATLTGGSISTGTGLVAGDVVNLSTASASGSFADRNVGVGKSVTATGYTISGTDSGNYTLAQPTGLTATITPKALSVTGVSAFDKIYDSTTTATLNNSSAALTGVIGADTVSLTTASAVGSFANKNVGVGKSVTASGFTLGGSDSGNYTLTQPTGLTATISARTLFASLTGTVAKTFDGTANATLGPGNYLLSGVLGSDGVTLNNPTVGTYDTPAIGTNKGVSVTGLTLVGLDAPNYLLFATAITGAIGRIDAVSTTQPSNTPSRTMNMPETARIVYAQPATSAATTTPTVPAIPATTTSMPDQSSYQDLPPLEYPNKPIYNLVKNPLIVEVDPSLQWFFNIPPRL